MNSDFGRSRALDATLIGLFLAILSLRIYFCFQIPSVTSDTFRQLGFASHAFDADTAFYALRPGDFVARYGEDQFGNNVALPEKLSYLRR